MRDIENTDLQNVAGGVTEGGCVPDLGIGKPNDDFPNLQNPLEISDPI